MCIGALVATRKRDSPLGWLLLAIGMETALSQLSYRYGLLHFVKPGVIAPGPASTSSTVHLEDTLDTMLATALFLLFPTGRPPTPRWRGLLYASVTIGVVSVVARWLVPGQLGDLPGVINPFGVASLGPAARVVRDASVPILNVLFLIAVASLIVRWRRAAGVERQQIKWVALAAATLVTFVIIGNLADAGLLGNTLAPLGEAFFFVILIVPAAIGVAVLRYRLYDIDLVISRALIFATLAAFVTAVYVSIVVGLGQVVSSNGRPNAALSIAATAITAVAFQPVRARARDFANRLVYGDRPSPYEVLSGLSTRLIEQSAPEEQLLEVARLLARGTGGIVLFWLQVGAELHPVAGWPEGEDHPPPAPFTSGDTPMIGKVDRVVPVVHHDETLGFVTLRKPANDPVSPTDDKLMRDIASQTGLVLRNARLSAELHQRLDELRSSRERLVAAQDEERRRLERDLHDGAQQQLVALKIKLGIARSVAADEDAQETTKLIEKLVGEAEDAVQTLRELAHGIYPPLLAAEGLRAALRSQAAKAVAEVEVEVGDIGRYGEAVEATVYFCCLEALQNVAKYSPSANVLITLEEGEGDLSFTVADNGIGFDEATTTRGAGLQNMEDRVDAVGGTLAVTSTPGTGTSISGRIPIARESR